MVIAQDLDVMQPTWFSLLQQIYDFFMKKPKKI